MMQPEIHVISDFDQPQIHQDWRADDHLINILALNASNHGHEVAMRERDHGIWQEYTWQDYFDQVLGFAAGIDWLGIGPHENVLVIGDNRPTLYFGMLGVVMLRAIPSPSYLDVTSEELAAHMKRENIHFALAEDQEQVDKLLSVRERYPGLRWIIYDDPRGLAGKEPEGVTAFSELVDRGRERLSREPALKPDLLGRSHVEDVAVLLHSSGTTGAPKGIPLKHGHILSAVRSAAAADAIRERDVHVAYLPMAWVGDFIFSVSAALALRFIVNIPERQETVLHDLREIAPTMYLSSPRAWSNMLTRIQVGIDESTGFKRWLCNHFISSAVGLERRRLEGREPNVLDRFQQALGELLVYGPIKDQLGLARVERAFTGGEALGEDAFLFFRALGLNLRQFYGQTENCALCAAQGSNSVNLHTVGEPFPGVELKISDDGEILIRGDNVFDGYYNKPEATAETLQDGWLHTGDAGYLENDGQVVVLGRVSEVVYTRSGERFIPTYIENRIKFSQYIKDVCVLGKDREYLSALVAIDLGAVGHWAQERGIASTSFAELSQKEAVYDLIQGLMEHTNKLLPEGLRIRRFVNLHKEFDPDDGEVTRTRKLRRNVIDYHYAPIISAIYDGRDELEFEAQIAYETGESGVLKRKLVIRNVPAVSGKGGRG